MSVPTESQISAAIVTVYKSVTGIGLVHDWFVQAGLIGDLNDKTVDDNDETNVVYVERVSVTTIVNSRHRPTRDIHEYLCWFYYGYKEALSSGRKFQELVEAHRLKFREAANEHLGIGPNVHHDGLVVVAQMQLASLGSRNCHRAVEQIKVYVDLDC